MSTAQQASVESRIDFVTPPSDSFLNAPTIVLAAGFALAGAYLAGTVAGPDLFIQLVSSVGAGVTVLGFRLLAYKAEPYALAARSWNSGEPRRFLVAQQQQLDGIRSLSPKDFEEAVRALYQTLGYSAVRTPYSGDGGWDVEAIRGSERLLIECKHYGEGRTIGRSILQKLHSAVVTEAATGGVLVTTGRFSRPAYLFASEVGLSLIDASGLAGLLAHAYPIADSSLRATGMCPKCGGFAQFDLTRDDLALPCPEGHPVVNPLAAAVKAQAFGADLVQEVVGGRGGRHMNSTLRSTMLCIASARRVTAPNN